MAVFDAIEHVLRVAFEHIGTDKFNDLLSVDFEPNASPNGNAFKDTLNVVLPGSGSCPPIL